MDIPEVLMGVKTGTAPARPIVITPTHADAWVFFAHYSGRQPLLSVRVHPVDRGLVRFLNATLTV